MSRTLLAVAAALFLLVLAAWLLSHVDLGGWAVPLALSISGAKAFLIAWYFMELHEARTSVRASVVAAILLFVLLVGLTAVDVGTRAPPPLLSPAGALR